MFMYASVQYYHGVQNKDLNSGTYMYGMYNSLKANWLLNVVYQL